MIPVLSVVTSVKDYLEVVHKLIEYDSDSFSQYTELGPIITYFVLSLKSFFIQFFSLSWLKNVWSLPIIIPDISSAMISEISVLDGYFHNAFQVLDTPTLSPNEKTIGLVTGLEKLTIGLLNSCFLFLPTSTAHIITLRRFVMQGLDAGYISGLGTIAGNIFWLASVILGWRFFVIPWLSLDILRYLLGFALLVKYMWDSYNERKTVLQDLSKKKIFLFNFLLALTEQTSIYPFISNISVSPEASVLESFPADNYPQFLFIHMSYLAGIALGSFCLLQLTCWFWENPAFKIYMWVISSFKVSTGFYYKALNFVFLYLTMLSAISSIPYYGLDYTITNPLGFVNDDRLVQDKTILETSFLGTKASDRNTRRNRGRHGRRERWKRRIRKYRTFDASLYDQGIYDLFTIEDLNYGFDRFWLRRKLRNHRVRFRFFPGPWMRSFKKQLAKPRLESYTGPRIEFFRTLFEQVYHPSFHARTRGAQNALSSFDSSPQASLAKNSFKELMDKNLSQSSSFRTFKNMNTMNGTYRVKKDFINENSMLRKFVRKLDSRLKTSEIIHSIDSNNLSPQLNKTSSSNLSLDSQKSNKIYSKRWKEIFSKIYHEPKEQISTSKLLFKNVHRNFYNSSLTIPKQMNIKFLDSLDEKQKKKTLNIQSESVKKQSSGLNTLSNKDLQILRYRSILTAPLLNDKTALGDSSIQPFLPETAFPGENSPFYSKTASFVLLHPLKFYLQQEASLQRKLRYYTPNVFRKFSVENNAPYFRVMMRRYFYNYKPTSRWERTMQVASLRKARRKTTRTPRKLRLPQLALSKTNIASDLKTTTVGETKFPAPVSKENSPVLQSKTGVSIKERSSFIDRGSRGNEVSPTGANLILNNSELQTNQSIRLAERIEKPTFNYSVVSKKASRYRYQIYKDVMQHWYYSPFNRLLLKFDVDNFIRRQPKTHFLTSNEENLLHLRRFFLSEHYNTLRWYTNMEHYRTMKTQIGGSKSFSSRAYNQQFTGTFKKIRHLFSITPTINSSFPFDTNATAEGLVSQAIGKSNRVNVNSNLSQQENSTTVLKFDQPLYNEYPNNSKNPLLNPLIIHEELLNDRAPQTSKPKNFKDEDSSLNNKNSNPMAEGLAVFYENGEISPGNKVSGTNIKTLLTPNATAEGLDLLSQSQNIVRNYLINSSQERNEYIKELLKNNNYASLTQFLYNGQKLRGNSPIVNQKLLGLQEKEYLLTDLEKENIEKQYNSPNRKRLLRQNFSDFVSVAETKSSRESLLPLKTGSDSSVSKKQTKSEPLTGSLDNLYTTFLKNWKYRVNNQESLKNYLTRRIDKREKTKITKEKNLQKKLKLLNNWSKNAPNLENLSIRVSNDSSTTSGSNLLTQNARSDDSFSSKLYNSESVTSGLQKAIMDGKKTSNLDSSLSYFSNSINENSSVSKLSTLRITQKKKLNREIEITTNKLHNIRKQLDKKPLSRKTVLLLKTKLRSLIKKIKKTYGGLSFFNFNKILFLVKPMKEKTIKNWRQKQRSIGKQKRLRKEFKLLLTKKQPNKQTVFNLPNRKKRSDSQSVNLESTNPKKEILDLNDVLANDSSRKNSFFNNRYVTSFFNFKRERSPQRRYRVRRNRGVFRKRNLGDLMKKDIRVFYNKTSLSDSFLSPQNTIERNKFYSKMYSVFGKITLENTEPVLNLKENGGGTVRGNFVSPTEQLVALEPESNLKSLSFKEERVKQRKNKQRKLRSWKQKRMSIRSSQKRRKYLKRRRYTISKIRVLSKQFQRVKNKLEVQNWWWKQYLPSIQASTDALWQIEKDRLIQQKLSELSPQEILSRDSNKNLNKGTSSKTLQIGNKDFKPLALPQAIRFQSSLQSVDNQSLDIQSLSSQTNSSAANKSTEKDSFLSNSNLLSETGSSAEEEFLVSDNKPQTELINQLYTNLLTVVPSQKGLNANKNMDDSMFNNSAYTGLLPNTSLPFYAGWDESLRKFVVTNRLLSRQDAGYEVDNSFVERNAYFESKNLFNDSNYNKKEKFTEAPLQGMNAATTLYWQIPFTTYDPDQFFALGMDGFSPIAWRKMIFRHSILKSWLGDKMMLNKNMDSSYTQEKKSMIGIKNTSNHQDLLNTLQKYKMPQEESLNKTNRQDAFSNVRNLNKRLLRVKKHPRTPVWFPSGPLLNQVLPVHYIYVFYKRSRLPRNRYLSRRLLSVDNINNNDSLNILKSSNPAYYNYDFTLRKRLKPKRKYHLKHDSSIVIPRRLKLLNLININSDPVFKNNGEAESSGNALSGVGQPEDKVSGRKEKSYDQLSLIRWRPLSSKKINKSFAQLMNEQKTLRAKRQQRLANPSQTDQPSLRVKQLKRRVQRQTIRSVWRYRPRAGGFVWPGDYLKMELVKAPKLKHMDLSKEILVQNEKDSRVDDGTLKRKTKRKKKRTLVEWQIQPKKYHYAKHNMNVLKRKLEKAQRSGNLSVHKKLKEVEYKI